MTDEPFTPANDLERALVACHEDLAHWPAFVHVFLSSQIFILVEGDVAHESPKEPKPLILESPSGFQSLLLFTSPGRAKPFAQRFPRFGSGRLVDCRWILSTTGPDLGLAINPGWSVGLEMEPRGFAKFRKDFGLV